jgi:formylglycine-generating enzyme required for sulfatase activity
MRTFLPIALHIVFCCFPCGACDAENPKEVTNSIGMKFVLIPKGAFVMGSPANELGREDDEVQHQVTINRDFYLGVFEVTQSQYQKVMGENPSEFVGAITSNFPVDSVSWDDAVRFCEELSELPEESKIGRTYRLPTEAEWEYACRAGSKTAYRFGDSPNLINDFSWYARNSSNQTHPVGQKKSNAWGLYDMHGNVMEWCADFNGDYPQRPVTNPRGPKEGSERIYRGGAWLGAAEQCRSACRNSFTPESGGNSVGLRIAISVSKIGKQSGDE